MALHESKRTSFASTGRLLATLAGLILVPPFALLALLPMLLFLVPVAIVGVPFMVPAFVTGLAAIRGESKRLVSNRPRLVVQRVR